MRYLGGGIATPRELVEQEMPRFLKTTCAMAALAMGGHWKSAGYRVAQPSAP